MNFTPVSGTINFAPIKSGIDVIDNQHTGFITVFIPDNNLIQGAVTFHLTLTSSDVAQLGPTSTTQIIVEDDDGGNVAVLSAANFTVSEAGPFAMITMNLVPSGDPTKTSIVDFSATSITAFAGFDFAPLTTTLVFQPGEFSKTVLVPILRTLLPSQQRHFE